MKYSKKIGICSFVFVCFLAVSVAHSAESLMVMALKPLRVDSATSEALSETIKGVLADYYDVQSMDALAAINVVVAEKLKAGCDDTKCIIDLAGAMDIRRVVAGSISRLGDYYILNLQLISSRGSQLGVIKRAKAKCRFEGADLVALAEQAVLELVDIKQAGTKKRTVQKLPQIRDDTISVKSYIAADYPVVKGDFLNTGFVERSDRFVRTKLGTVLDSYLKLEWTNASSSIMSHDGARAYCRQLGSGWRLPTIDELKTLVTLNRTGRLYLDERFFSSVAEDMSGVSQCWTSTNEGIWFGPKMVLVINFQSRQVLSTARKNYAQLLAVRSQNQ